MSGIYIKGMEMPDRCFSCPLCNIEPTGESSCATSIGPIIEYKEIAVETAIDTRPDWCPLVPVPDHGRLIDADALGIREAEKQAYEAYLREKGEFFVEEPLLEYMRGRLEGLVDASGRVRFAPTIIPADKEGEG